jgi:hypothetical protein
MEPYSDTSALAAALEGRAAAEDARNTRKRLRRRTRPGAKRRTEELERALTRVREAKRRLRRFNARAAYYAVPAECQAAADELRLEYQQLWKMLKTGEGRGDG